MPSLEKHVKSRSGVPAIPTKRDGQTEGMTKLMDHRAKPKASGDKPRVPAGGAKDCK